MLFFVGAGQRCWKRQKLSLWMDEFSSFSLTCIPIFVEIKTNIPLLFLVTKRSFEHQKNNYKIVSHQLSQIDPFRHFYLSLGCYIIKCYFRLILACIRMQQFQKYDSFLFLNTLISLGKFSPYLKMSFGQKVEYRQTDRK